MNESLVRLYIILRKIVPLLTTSVALGTCACCRACLALFTDSGDVINNRLAVNLDVDSIYTLTTSKFGNKGDHGKVPKSGPFPLPYHDDFEGYGLNEEPYLLSPQVGSWEILKDPDGNQFARQVVQSPTVAWCMKDTARYPAAVLGDINWQNTTISARIRVPSVNGTSKVFLAVRFSPGGCNTHLATGLLFWLTPNSNGYTVTTDYAGLNITDAGTMDNRIVYDKWYNISISIESDTFSASVDNKVVSKFILEDDIVKSKSGWNALGTGGWGQADFDDLEITE